MTVSHRPWSPNPNAPQIVRVFWQTLFLNLAVAAAKLWIGFSTGVLSLIADGFHSLLDSSANIVGIVAIKVGAKPPNEYHPYGHRKFEALGAIIISFFLFLASLEVFREAWQRVLNPQATELSVNWVSYGVVILSLGVSAWVSRYERAAGKRLNSDLLLADASHTWTDVYNGLSILVALVAIQLGWVWLDWFIAMVIVVLIFKTGYDIIQVQLGTLTDAIVIPASEVEAVVLAVEGVRGCHHIRSRGNRDHAFLDLHILVDPTLSVKAAHLIADAVEAKLYALNTLHVVDVMVHIEEDGHQEPSI